MLKLKILIGLLLVNTLSLSALANDEMSRPSIWKQISSCDAGAAVIDVDIQDRGPFHTGVTKQVVIRDSGIVRFFKSRGAYIPLNTEGTEVLVKVYGHIDSLSGFLESWNSGEYINVSFKAEGHGYKLTFTGIVTGYTDGDGYVHPERRYEIANWFFNHCESIY